MGQRDVLAGAARRLSYLSLQDPILLQYGSRLTVNKAPTLWDSTCFSRNRVKVGIEVEIEKGEKDKALNPKTPKGGVILTPPLGFFRIEKNWPNAEKNRSV